jgi:hypothetical protein
MAQLVQPGTVLGQDEQQRQQQAHPQAADGAGGLRAAIHSGCDRRQGVQVPRSGWIRKWTGRAEPSPSGQTQASARPMARAGTVAGYGMLNLYTPCSANSRLLFAKVSDPEEELLKLRRKILSPFSVAS